MYHGGESLGSLIRDYEGILVCERDIGTVKLYGRIVLNVLHVRGEESK